MTKLAVMQPYWFPYIGYFQLLYSTDKFVFLDDVNFMKKGWINRNRFICSGQEKLITIPLVKSSQNKKIKDIAVVFEDQWKRDIIKLISHSYSKSPYFDEVMNLVINSIDSKSSSISDFSAISIVAVMDYLGGFDVEISYSSEQGSIAFNGQNRIISMCEKSGCSTYINLMGGMHLYNKQEFLKRNISLLFLHPKIQEYPQHTRTFIPGLSIIDVLMMNSPQQVRAMLNNYDLA